MISSGFTAIGKVIAIIFDIELWFPPYTGIFFLLADPNRRSHKDITKYWIRLSKWYTKKISLLESRSSRSSWSRKSKNIPALWLDVSDWSLPLLLISSALYLSCLARQSDSRFSLTSFISHKKARLVSCSNHQGHRNLQQKVYARNTSAIFIWLESHSWLPVDQLL